MVVDYAGPFYGNNIFAVLDALHTASGCERLERNPQTGFDAERYHGCLDDVLEALRYRTATPVRDFAILGDISWMKRCATMDVNVFDELVTAVVREDVSAMKALKRRVRYENMLLREGGKGRRRRRMVVQTRSSAQHPNSSSSE